VSEQSEDQDNALFFTSLNPWLITSPSPSIVLIFVDLLRDRVAIHVVGGVMSPSFCGHKNNKIKRCKLGHVEVGCQKSSAFDVRECYHHSGHDRAQHDMYVGKRSNDGSTTTKNTQRLWGMKGDECSKIECCTGCLWCVLSDPL
jgi:hypothetical protein